jgi:hypothetical protein
MKIKLLFILAISYTSLLSAQSQKQLFNLKNLDGWIVYGTELWYVDKSELVCESGPDKQYGYLGTVDQYKDFDLTLEFKPEANGNSGVFFSFFF